MSENHSHIQSRFFRKSPYSLSNKPRWGLLNSYWTRPSPLCKILCVQENILGEATQCNGILAWRLIKFFCIYVCIPIHTKLIINILFNKVQRNVVLLNPLSARAFFWGFFQKISKI